MDSLLSRAALNEFDDKIHMEIKSYNCVKIVVVELVDHNIVS